VILVRQCAILHEPADNGGLMKRRAFIRLLGVAASWPMTSLAQTPSNPAVGFVHARSRDDTLPLVAAFRQALAESGFVDGQNLAVEYRFAGGDYKQLQAMVSDLLGRSPNVLVTGADPAAVVGKKAAGSLPMAFVVGGDPVALGLVSSLNWPGGNATGMTILTTSLEPKRLGLLRELMPSNAAMALLVNPNLALAQIQAKQVQEAADAVNLKLNVLWVGNDNEIKSALDKIAGDGITAVLVGADPFFDTRRGMLAAWAIEHKVAMMAQFREYAAEGCLMSYGINLPSVYRQLGVYVARILKGEKPADMPVLQPTQYEFLLNLKTAKRIGIDIPSGLLAIADEVIE
jgi:putative tryptophan/tyrosine transport system substrate-binding protein